MQEACARFYDVSCANLPPFIHSNQPTTPFYKNSSDNVTIAYYHHCYPIKSICSIGADAGSSKSQQVLNQKAAFLSFGLLASNTGTY